MYFKLYEINYILVILFVSCLVWWSYNCFVRPKKHFLGETIYDPPHWFKCNPLVKNISINPKKNKCEKITVDGWTVMHIVMYIVLGMFIPGKLLFVLVLSVVCEIFEYFSGWRARWIFDPAANILGYWIGSLFVIKNLAAEKYLSKTVISYILGGLILLLLLLNRPCFMPGDPDKYM